jgi:hypothetical protein
MNTSQNACSYSQVIFTTHRAPLATFHARQRHSESSLLLAGYLHYPRSTSCYIPCPSKTFWELCLVHCCEYSILIWVLGLVWEPLWHLLFTWSWEKERALRFSIVEIEMYSSTTSNRFTLNKLVGEFPHSLPAAELLQCPALRGYLDGTMTACKMQPGNEYPQWKRSQ